MDLKAWLRNIFFSPAEQKQIVDEAQNKARDIVRTAQEQALKYREEAERDSRRITASALEAEKLIAKQRNELGAEKSNLGREKAQIDKEKQDCATQKAKLEASQKELETKQNEVLEKLEKVASLTRDEARAQILQEVEDKMTRDVAQRIKVFEEDYKRKAGDIAKQLLVDCMRFGATDYVAEYTMSLVRLPDDSYKGRVIGKEGRNIRALELATGVDFDLDEEGVIKLSSFDAVRREIARISLEQLIRDGRVQPARIEELVDKNRREIEKQMFKAGEELAHKVGVYNLPAELVSLLGRFKYRYSYGQNTILHTLEETRIGIALAQELKCDVNVVRLGCLFHDIGKVVDKEGENHIALGVELLKKHRMSQHVIDVVESHHEDVPLQSLEAVIVYIADAVSGGRPGARHEDLGDYMKRIETIENTAKLHKGVREAYALQAGRELRVVVRPQEVSDDQSVLMARTIKEDLEKQFEVFPGQITVTVIREYRAAATTRI